MSRKPGATTVVVVRSPGAPDEFRVPVRGLVRPTSGFFDVDTLIREGDFIEIPAYEAEPQWRLVRRVDHFTAGAVTMHHSHVHWVAVDPATSSTAEPRSAAPISSDPGGEPATDATPVTIGVPDLHERVIAVAGEAYRQGRHGEAVAAAFAGLTSRGAGRVGAFEPATLPPLDAVTTLELLAMASALHRRLDRGQSIP